MTKTTLLTVWICTLLCTCLVELGYSQIDKNTSYKTGVRWVSYIKLKEATENGFNLEFNQKIGNEPKRSYYYEYKNEGISGVYQSKSLSRNGTLFFPDGKNYFLHFTGPIMKGDLEPEFKYAYICSEDKSSISSVSEDEINSLTKEAINRILEFRDKKYWEEINENEIPEAVMDNDEWEKGMLEALRVYEKEKKWTQTPYTEIRIMEKDWSMIRHSKTGVLLGRKIKTVIFAPTKKDENLCMFVEYWFAQEHNGETFNDSFVVNELGNSVYVNCQKLEGLK